jgi:hypothetical protein
MILSGILTAVSFIAIAAKFSPTFLQKCLGYEWAVDIVFSLGLMWLFAYTGAISGIMIGVITGLAISAILYITKNLYKYQKYERTDTGGYAWVTYNGKWTIAYFVQKIKASSVVYETFVNEVRSEWNNGEAQAA